VGVFSTWIIELGLALVHTTASGTSSIMRVPKNNMLKQAHKLLTIQALNKKMLKYVAMKQRKFRTSVNMPKNVIVITFKLVGALVTSNMNTSLSATVMKSTRTMVHSATL